MRGSHPLRDGRAVRVAEVLCASSDASLLSGVLLCYQVICGGGAYLAAQAYKNEGGLPYTLAPTMDPDFEMNERSSGRASVPITPDVTFTN